MDTGNPYYKPLRKAFTGHASAVGTFLLLAALAPVTVVAGTIIGSPHDFSAQGWSGGELCIACHVPAHFVGSNPTAPFWNHATTTLTFTPYSSNTMDSNPGQPDGTSKLCLSCHDGSVAVDSFGGELGSTYLGGHFRIGSGGDLSGDHPISMTYDTTLANADPGLADPAIKMVTIGSGTLQKTGTIATVLLNGGKVQCTSCHDVHNSYTIGGAFGNPLLKMSKSGSKLCLACHVK